MDISDIESLRLELQSFAKHPSKRTPDDLAHILKLTSHVPFFKKITEDRKNEFIHREACKFLRLQIFERKEPVVFFGEIGEEFFIILRGSVGVFIPEKVTKTKSRHTENELKRMITQNSIEANSHLVTEISKTEEIMKRIFKDQLVYQLNLLKRANSKLDLKFLRKFGEIEKLKEVSTLNEGDSFGELSLISDKPRAATIICKEYCIFASLNKAEFTKILSKETEKALQEKAVFLQTLPIFSRTPKGILIKLSYYFTEHVFHKHQYVYKAGDSVDSVYFIKSGEFKMAKWRSFKAKPVIRQGSDMLLKFSNVREIPQGIDLQFSIKTKNEMFGQEEVVDNFNQREFSVICLSTAGIVYSIPKSEFKLRLSNPESKAYLRNRRHFTSKRESEITNSEKMVTEMRTPDKKTTSKFETFLNIEELEEMRTKLKNLRRREKKRKILRSFDTPRSSPKEFELRKSFVESALPSPRISASPKREKVENEVTSTGRKIKRVPPPNFMIGMRDLSRFYDEDSRLCVLNKRTFSQ